MKTVREIYEECNNIRGYFGIQESTILIGAASELLLANQEPPIFVELGAWCGRSAMMLGLMAKRREGSKVYAVDAWTEETRHPVLPITNEEAERAFLETREDLELQDIVIQLKGRTADIGGEWQASKRINLLHVDAGHTFEACYMDLVIWEPFVASNGIIILHDYNNIRECGVKRAAEIYFADKPYMWEGSVEGYSGSWRKEV